MSKKFVVFSILIATIYVFLTIYLMNVSLVKDTIFGSYPMQYKITLMTALLGGMWTAMSGMGLTLLIITAILTGANLVLLIQRVQQLKDSGKLHLAIGGSTLLGIVGSGCTACGLPILALFGLSGSLVFLPLHGLEISYLSVALLGGSLYLMIRSNQKAISCKINPRRVR